MSMSLTQSMSLLSLMSCEQSRHSEMDLEKSCALMRSLSCFDMAMIFFTVSKRFTNFYNHREIRAF